MSVVSKIELVTNPYGSRPSPLDADENEDFLGAIVRGPWSSQLAREIRDREIRALYLNHSLGWVGDNIDFLSEVPDLEVLDILGGRIDDLTAIEGLRSLRFLSIQMPTKKAVDFPSLRSLHSCTVSWWPGAESLFANQSIRSLRLYGAHLRSCVPLIEAKQLHKVMLGDSRRIESLDGLEELPNLRKLELLECRKLQDITALRGVPSLRWLVFDCCRKIEDLGAVLADLPHLELLEIANLKREPNLSFLAKLTALRGFEFSGTVIADGDLSILETLPELRMLRFDDRRHYSHRSPGWNWNNYEGARLEFERR